MTIELKCLNVSGLQRELASVRDIGLGRVGAAHVRLRADRDHRRRGLRPRHRLGLEPHGRGLLLHPQRRLVPRHGQRVRLRRVPLQRLPQARAQARSGNPAQLGQ